MQKTDESTAGFLERCLAWAESCDDIRALAVVGPQLEENSPDTEPPDLDVIVFANDPEHYATTTEWLAGLGQPCLSYVERHRLGDNRERRVLFEDGLDIDFILVAAKKAQPLTQLLRIRKRFALLTRLLPKKKVRRIIKDGVGPLSEAASRELYVLLDRDGIAEDLSLASSEVLPSRPPTQAEFAGVVSEFFYHAIWTARKLRSGELWVAKSCCDGDMKWLLRRILEWHTGAAGGWKQGRRRNSRRVEQWADPRALEALQAAYARYERADVEKALLATIDLFSWVAVETAERLTYPYSEALEERARRWVLGSLATVAPQEPACDHRNLRVAG